MNEPRSLIKFGKVIHETEFLLFTQMESKTPLYNVFAKTTECTGPDGNLERALLLGPIVWFDSKKQFVFYDQSDYRLNATCVNEITAFTERLTRERNCPAQ